MENSNPDFLQCHLHVPFIVHRPDTLAHAVSHILPDIAAKCPNTYAPWVLLGMKKDLRTNPKTVYNLKREGSNFVSMEEARNIGHKYGAEMVMECSSRREAQGSWILRKRLPHFLTCVSIRLSSYVRMHGCFRLVDCEPPRQVYRGLCDECTTLPLILIPQSRARAFLAQ